MNRKDLHRAHDIFIAISILASWLTLAVCSGCEFVSEGFSCDSSSSGEPDTDAAAGDSSPGTSSGSTTTSATLSPTSSVAESGESGESAGDGPGSSTSTGTGETDVESSAGSSSETTGADPVSCANDQECGEGMWCNWFIGYFCDPIYAEAHCDESCLPGDRINTEQNGTEFCVCAPTCVDDSDCNSPATCGSFGATDRCFINCAVVPCSGNTPGLSCPPTLVPDEPAVYMCTWFEV